MTESWLIFGLSFLIAAILFWTQYEVTIDRNKKYYKRALFVIGIRFGKKRSYDQIESCLLIKGQYTDIYMLGPFGIDSEGEMYHAFLKFSNNDLLQIGKSKKRVKLLETINFFRFDHGFDIIESVDDQEELADRTTLLRKSTPQNKVGRDLTIAGIVTLILSIAAIMGKYYEGYLSLFHLILVVASMIAIIVGIFKMRKLKRKQESLANSR